MLYHTKEDTKLLLESLNRTLELNGYTVRYKVESWQSKKVTLCRLLDTETNRQISPIVTISDIYDILATLQNFIYYSLEKKE